MKKILIVTFLLAHFSKCNLLGKSMLVRLWVMLLLLETGLSFVEPYLIGSF